MQANKSTAQKENQPAANTMERESRELQEWDQKGRFHMSGGGGMPQTQTGIYDKPSSIHFIMNYSYALFF